MLLQVSIFRTLTAVKPICGQLFLFVIRAEKYIVPSFAFKQTLRVRTGTCFLFFTRYSAVLFPDSSRQVVKDSVILELNGRPTGIRMLLSDDGR